MRIQHIWGMPPPRLFRTQHFNDADMEIQAGPGRQARALSKNFGCAQEMRWGVFEASGPRIPGGGAHLSALH